MLKKILFLIIFISAHLSIYAQNIEKSINLGISRPTGDNSSYWKTGISISSHLFYSGSAKLLFGGHIGIQRWNSNKDELTKINNNDTEGLNIDSYGLILEFIPSVRYLIANTENRSFFTQAGFGIYTRNFQTTKIFINNLGINLGGGFLLRLFKKFTPEISILHNIILGEDKTFQYITLNTGIIF